MFSFCVVTILYITHHTASNASSSKNTTDSWRTLTELTNTQGATKTTPPKAFRIDNIVPGTNEKSLFVGSSAARAKQEHGTFANTTQHGN